MKKQIITLLSAALLGSPLFSKAQTNVSEASIAQQGVVKAAWVSDKGYWVAEGNVNNPTSHTIYFYNNNHELVYQEKLEGARLNLKKKKVKMRMKEALEASIAAWGSSTTATASKHLVAECLGIVSR